MAQPGTWLMVDVRVGILHILALSSRKEQNNHQETVHTRSDLGGLVDSIRYTKRKRGRVQQSEITKDNTLKGEKRDQNAQRCWIEHSPHEGLEGKGIMSTWMCDYKDWRIWHVSPATCPQTFRCLIFSDILSPPPSHFLHLLSVMMFITIIAGDSAVNPICPSDSGGRAGFLTKPYQALFAAGSSWGT